MDLPLPPSVDIYQIHRTPFFKRLRRNDSTQFEQLKKAYESVRNFDEKSLEIQIKKKRIEKLVSHIRDSLTISKRSSKRKSRPKPKSKQQIRCENLARARQVGIEYSRKNCNTIFIPIEESFIIEKSKLKRRLDYGNEISQINRSKIQKIQEQVKRSNVFASTTETLRKLLVNYLSEDQPDADVVRSFEKIAETKNHLYWDLMEAIKKQKGYIKRYGKLAKRLSYLALRNVDENQNSQREIYNSKTNVKSGSSSEVLIRTYRYSDDEYLPPPSESLLRMSTDLPDDIDEISTPDVFNTYTIKNVHMTLPNESWTHEVEVHAKPLGLSQKFGEFIRKTA